MSYKADITVVLDRSGSMQSIREDTIGGLNTFFADQKKEEGNDVITMIQFDDKYEAVFECVELEHVMDITEETFVPRGSTALLDAMGRTINATKARLDSLSEDKKPEKVIFIIITDGHENASREFTREQVFNMVTERTEKNGWHFIYLGANQDAIAVGRNIGISRDSAITYTSIKTRSTYRNLSRTVGSRKRGESMKMYGFSSTERQDSV